MTAAPMTAAPITTAQRVEQRIAELTKLRSERKDELDLPRTLTMRQVREYVAETSKLDAQIASVRNAAAAVTAFSTLDADIKWRDHLVKWRDALHAERLSMHPKIRTDAELDRKLALDWSLKFVEHGDAIATFRVVDLSSTKLGELMRADGYAVEGDGLRSPRGWRGSLSEVEPRIKQQSAERAKAHAALENLLRSDDEQAKLSADTQAFYAAMKTMTIAADADGMTLVAFDLAGEPLPIEKMSEAQRAAFERFRSIAEPRRQTTSTP